MGRDHICYKLYGSNKRGDCSIQKIGKASVPKGSCPEKYIETRYKNDDWCDRFSYSIHSSENAAYKEEERQTKTYVKSVGHLPPKSQRSAGGGRPIEND